MGLWSYRCAATPAPTPTPSPSPVATFTPPGTPIPTPPPTIPPTAPPTPSPAPITVGNYAATCELLSDAMMEIQASGLIVGFVFPSSLSADPTNARVAEQYPAAGTLVPPGTQVYLYVKGPADTCP